MSDGPRFSSNAGNGDNRDLYTWSGDQSQLPGNQGQNQSDRYIYDGSGRQNFQNGDDQHDAFQGDRMPGRPRPNDADYPQTFTTKEVRADGTIVINNVHCKNAFFNQTQIDGFDYRRDPKMDFRGVDPNVGRLRDNQGTSFYDDRPRQNDDFQAQMQIRIEAERRREFEQQQMQERRVDIARQRAFEQTNGQEQYIGQYHQYQQQRDCEQAIRIQMYNENCRTANGRDREMPQPYYSGGNDGCFGNGNRRHHGGWNNGNNGGWNNGGWNNGGWNDGGWNDGGGPCFGNQRAGISMRIPIGHHGSFRISL